jgi:hypothetical protein
LISRTELERVSTNLFWKSHYQMRCVHQKPSTLSRSATVKCGSRGLSTSITQNGKPPSVKILFTITPQPVKTIAPIFVYVYFLILLRSKSIKHMQFKFLSVLSPMPIHHIIRCLEHGWMEQDCSRRNPTRSLDRLLNGADTCLSKVLREWNRVVEDYDRKRFGVPW